MARPWGSKRRLLDEYARDLRGRERRPAARRRVRTVREFSRFLAPRPLEDASPEDLSEWAITKVDESERAERRADLAHFYQWHRAREGGAGPDADGTAPEPATTGPVEGGLPGEAATEREGPGAAEPASEEERRRRSRQPVHVDFRPPRPKSRYSWPKRLATALLLGLVTVLWMVTLIIPDRRTDLTTTTSEGRAGRPGLTTTTTAPMHPRGEVTVLALNASGVPTRGDDLNTSLTGAGYKVVPPEQAPAPVPNSTVYWTPGYEREARALADALLVPVEIAAAPMPDPPLVPDLKQANVVVVLGQDLAR